MSTEAAAAVAAPVAAPAAQPAVAAAPVIPAAPAPAAAAAEAPKVETTPTGLPAHTYEASGDAALDVALQFVGGLGFGPDTPAMQAAFRGDFAPLEAALAALGDKAKGYENMVALGKQAYERDSQKAAQASAAINKAVHDTVGGEQNWAAISAWASKTADPAEKEAINAMFKAGPVQARAAAQMLKGLYDTANGTVVNPASAVRKDASGTNGQPASTAPMSRREYTDAVAKLSRQLGGSMETSPQYHQLNARYMAGLKQ